MIAATDRTLIRSAALKIIRAITEKPDFDAQRRGGMDVRKDWLAPPPLTAFRRLEPMGFGLVKDDWWVFDPKDCKADVVWPMDVGIVWEKGGNDGLIMSRTYTITAKMARGYAKHFSPFMVRTDHAQMDREKLARVAFISSWVGGRWVDAESRTQHRGGIPVHATAEDILIPNLATGVALRQRYEWAVSLSLDESPSVRFATDPTGIKDVFRIRDLPEGRDRREALMTWVSDHWRQDRTDPELQLYVRKHLRGATAFSWKGMECELLPSQFDLDRRDKAQAERAAMRSAGTDRRVKNA